jgi:signal recognition particle GTPase
MLKKSQEGNNIFDPGELHTFLEGLQQDSASSIDKLDIAKKLLELGVPMTEIPINDLDKLMKMYNEQILNLSPEEEEDETFKSLFSSNICSKLANVSNFIESKGFFKIADHIDNMMEEEIDEDIIEEEVTPKDFEDILDKLQSIIDISGDSFDPDLIPILKKYLLELFKKFDELQKS